MSQIATVDDCISLNNKSKQIKITNVTCGPGHGISIGSLGKYTNEEPVEGIIVKNCMIINTTNGVRIKTWPASAASSTATDMQFLNIIMVNVSNPILIDQEYCLWNSCNRQVLNTFSKFLMKLSLFSSQITHLKKFIVSF